MFARERFREITSQISQKDEKLGSLFSRLSEQLGGIFENERRRGNIYKEIEKEISGLASRSNINLIPSDKRSECREYCISLAFNKWGSKSKKSPGFKKVASQTINYWLGCSDVNKGTLILTSAWDEYDFESRFKKSFYNYAARSNHTVAVVLITKMEATLAYLK